MEDFYSFIRPLLQNCYFLPEHRKQEIEELTMAFKKYDNLKLCHFRLFHAINLPQTRLRELGENVASDVEDDENDDDITWPSRAS